MKPKHHSAKPEEKPTGRVFSVGGTAPEDNPFSALLHLRQSEKTEPSSPETTSTKPQPPTPHSRLDLSKQTATVMRTSKGHAGKTVTLISGLKLSNQLTEEVLHHLKKRLGIGGTVERGETGLVLLLQGDVRDRVQSELEHLKAKVKRAGG